MILRKPYAFFIKQFKLIHLILTIMMAYLMYRTGLLLTFFNEYVGSTKIVTGQNLTGAYFNIYVFLVPFLIAIASIIILSVMSIKKKPILFYIINIVISIIILLVFNHTYSVIGEMEIKLVDIRVIRVVRDLLMMAVAAEFISTIITLVRATGFDIKKFNFGEDLAELEITEEDSEEFEVEVEVDTDLFKRKLRRRFRYAKYVYIENKFLINIALLLVISFTCFITYLNVGVYNKKYGTNVAFVTRDFLMKVNNAYITKKDYAGNIVSDNTVVILDLSVRNRSISSKKMNNVKTVLVIEGHKFYPTLKYRDYLTDMGVTYQSDSINNKSFQNYILTYEIPNNYANKNMTYMYIDDSNYFSTSLEVKTIKVSLKARNLDKISLVDHYNIGETVTFKDSVFKKTDLKINNFDIQSQFTINYNFCLTSDDCYSSTEYIKPSIYNIYDKVLIKVNATLSWDDSLTIQKDTDVYNFISKYGKIKYKLGNEVKYHNVLLKEVKSQKVKNNNYYIEVIKEVMSADSISIVFQIRDKHYEYILK